MVLYIYTCVCVGQVDVTNVYGKDKEAENKLRSFSGGKLKMQVRSATVCSSQ